MLKWTYYYKNITSDTGFSESWYDVQGFPDLATGLAKVLAYVGQRLKLSGPQTQFRRCRISTVGSKRPYLIVTDADVKGQGFSITGVCTTDGHTLTGTDDPDSTLVVNRYWSGGQGRIFMRGIPDELFTMGGRYAPFGTFAADFSAWAAQITGPLLQYGLLAQPVNLAGSPYTINLVTEQPDGTLLFAVNAPGFPATPRPMHYAAVIRGSETPTTLNGGLTIVVPAAGGLQCMSLRELPLGNFVASPELELVVKTSSFQRVTRMNFNPFAGSRREGKPFGQPKGKSKPVRAL